MKLPSKERVLSSAVVFGLAGILVALAALQYRWSREVSEAAGARMRTSLQLAMMGFRQDLYRELGSVCVAFQDRRDLTGVPDSWDRYAENFETWKAGASHPGLVANVYVLEGAGGPHARFLRLNADTKKFELADWPSGFAPLAARLLATSPDIAGMAARLHPPERTRGGVPEAAPLHGGPVGDRGHFGGPWMIEEDIPALVHPVIRHSTTDDRPAVALNWLVIELSRDMLEGHILPELTERYFAGAEGLEYHVAVLRGSEFVYVSDSKSREQRIAGADGILPMFGGPPGPSGPRMGMGILVRPPGDAPHGGRVPPALDSHRFGFGGMFRLESIRHGAEDEWRLVVWHRRGSLDAVAASMRWRNLGMSFGILLVLAATMAMIIVASRRAHRLARLQMDFVAGVSHELRTPLAVISSAADNIADGVVDSKQQVIRYGKVIKSQTRQLRQLVEQILLFASSRQNRQYYNLGPVRVETLLDTVLNNTGELIHAAGFTVERNVEPGLPPVLGDLPALSHCLQNLITNAVKYGGDGRWLGIRAQFATNDDKHVEISVEDRGIGITSTEMPHIFEPFYRGSAATSAQIHGTGLGLPLAKSIAEAMGGRLTATSEPGHGSCFTLHLPAAEEAAPAAKLAASTAAGNPTSDGQV